ncbi:GNAT family N-acetyltransferase [Acidihalobacter yilgarnensis]|nr:GNAT family N-acetyltransferase [Acidihalobacter yilgarnensis]
MTGMSKPHIRIARPDDAIAIARIHVEAWRATYPGMMPQAHLDGLNAGESALRWMRVLSADNPATQVVLALDGHEHVAGFCVYGSSRDTDADAAPGELIALNIHPGAWRRGHGRRLCASVFEHAHAVGWQAITLWVVRDNHRARRFYEKQGFTSDRTEKQDPRFLDGKVHEVRYRRIFTD